MPTPSVAVIGAGIAGLTTALRLSERGYDVTVFEDRVNLGGKLGAHRHRLNWDKFDASGVAELSKELDARRMPKKLHGWVAEELAKKQSLFRPQRDTEPGDRGASRAPRASALFSVQASVRPAGKSPHARRKDAQEWKVRDPDLDRTFIVTRHHRDDNSFVVEVSDVPYHEHCYHMYLNWYHNFWQLMEDIGTERGQYFTAHEEIAHLFPGDTPIPERLRMLKRTGSLDSAGDNVRSGVASAPDLFLWFYSIADLVSERFDPQRFLDRVSVHGFMRSRWYATEGSVEFHEYLLSKAFAVPTYYSSAGAYRRFLAYGLVEPSPTLWVLKGNSYDRLFGKFEQTLESNGCRIEKGLRVTGFEWNAAKTRIVHLRCLPSDIYGPKVAQQDDEGPGEVATEGELYKKEKTDKDAAKFDYVVVAIPPAPLANLVNGFRDKVPGLATVRKLQSGVTAALDLYLTKQIPDLPAAHTVLRGSKFGLTFIDNSQLWEDDPAMKRPAKPGSPRQPITSLNVAATDFYMLDGMDKDTATKAIIEDLKQFIDLKDEDIDIGKTYLQMNRNEPLFVNEVGSELWRPGTRTDIPNLFLAGDFCENFIEVVTVEGAVVSGLQAARAVQAQLHADEPGRARADSALFLPIDIVEPETYPDVNASAVKLALAPWAMAAKAMSKAEDFARSPERALSSLEMKKMSADLLAIPGALATDWLNFAVDATRWIAEVPFSDEDK